MAPTTRKPPTRRTRNLPARPLAASSTPPSARSSLRPNSASIRAAGPSASWSVGRPRPSQPAPVSGRRHVGYEATRSAMGDMARSLERDPQLESILANRKQELDIAFESGRRLGQELAFTHGIDLGRGRGIGI